MKSRSLDSGAQKKRASARDDRFIGMAERRTSRCAPSKVGIHILKLETRNSKLRIVQLLLIGVLAIGFLGAGDDARFNKLGHGLMCMCGCGQVLLECNHVGCTYSERMRNELSAGIDRGDSDSLVLQSFVQKYGNTVLAAPTTTGFNRVAWIMPFAVFAGALALAVWLVRVWKQRSLAQPVPPPNLDATELDELRKKARQETDY